ncbi:Thymidylate kinase [Estrella lausannensis]|uniref:Thymidylate kinase n=2 Tax=Estrella lausannensis TaxID=483423 RepID=A0A0H5DT31_9BACT|nr:Thymidylate kinase [Estrella lausannensis]
MGMKKGYFITLEGGEGSGKTTLVQGLKKWLESQGFEVVSTREPGGTALGEKIREILLSSHKMRIGSLAELFLFLASRAQHLEEIVAPSIKRGAVVLCDRFNDSTVAYQGAARGLGVDQVRSLCSAACRENVPDCTLLLDIDPRVGLERSKATGKLEASPGAHDRIESEALNFHVTVREALLEEAKRDPMRIKVLDASLSKDKLLNDACHQLQKIFSGA